MSFRPPTEGSKRCQIYQGYPGPAQETLKEQDEVSFECEHCGYRDCEDCVTV